jgi:hypothetical protein
MKMTRESIQALALVVGLVIIYLITDVVKHWMTLAYEYPAIHTTE